MNIQTLVIDIGGTYIKYALIDDKCQITYNQKIKTPYESQEHFLSVLHDIYLEYKKYHINGIAISAPGLIDTENGIMITAGMVRYLDGIHLTKRLSEMCDNIPVTVENDGKAAALCESWVGVSKDCSNSVTLIFGTAIGGGVVINNQIYRGSDLLAGEFSPYFTDLKNDSYKTLAQEYSTLSIVEKVKTALQDPAIDGEKMICLYKENNSMVKQIFDEWTHAIAKFCFNLCCFYNPDYICIGGGISCEPLFIQKIEESCNKILENIYILKKPIIKTCKYYNDSNLIGAYYTFRQKYMEIDNEINY